MNALSNAWEIILLVSTAVTGFAIKFPATFRGNFNKLLAVMGLIAIFVIGWAAGSGITIEALKPLIPSERLEDAKQLLYLADVPAKYGLVILLAAQLYAYFLNWLAGQIIDHESKGKAGKQKE